MNILILRIFYCFGCAVLSLAFAFSVEELRADLDLNAQEQYVIVLLNSFGLANRLRALADWYQVATQLNRKLLLSWAAKEDCNALFPDIFQSNDLLRVLSPSLAEMQRDDAISALTEVVSLESGNFNGGNSINQSVGVFEDFVFFHPTSVYVDNTAWVLIATYNGLTTLENTPCQYYLQQSSYFLQSLKPIESVQSFVEDIVRNHFIGKVIVGVHIRTHDDRYDWPVVSPGESGPAHEKSSQDAYLLGEGASAQDFARIMDSIHSHFQFSLDEPTDIQQNAANDQQSQSASSLSLVKFFIASNDSNSKKALMDYFGEDSIGINIDVPDSDRLDRSSLQGIIIALTELHLLSHAHLIVHTHGSSFGSVAGRFRQIPTVSIWRGHALYTNSMYLPLCGVLDYFPLDGSTIKEDIASPGRPARQVRFRPCSLLNEWGVKDLYCVSR